MAGEGGGHWGKCGLFSQLRGARLTQSRRQAQFTTTSWVSELRDKRS